jgi:uncharacterized protein
MLDERAIWQRTVALFEDGAYWDAHDALEQLWLKAEGLDRELMAGVILLAAALHKARAMGSPRGGRRNYAKALAHLALLPDRYRGVEVRALEEAVHHALRDPSIVPRWQGDLPVDHGPPGERDGPTGVRA